MTLERAIFLFAGIVILLSVLLTYVVDTSYILLTVLIAVNLIQSSITGFCPSTLILKKIFKLDSSKLF